MSKLTLEQVRELGRAKTVMVRAALALADDPGSSRLIRLGEAAEAFAQTATKLGRWNHDRPEE